MTVKHETSAAVIGQDERHRFGVRNPIYRRTCEIIGHIRPDGRVRDDGLHSLNVKHTVQYLIIQLMTNEAGRLSSTVELLVPVLPSSATVAPAPD